MKKLLLPALLAVVVGASPASQTAVRAGNFGLFTGCSNCGCCSHICIRQYNAFTPICSGTFTSCGCGPWCPPPAPCCAPPHHFAPPGCMGGSCGGPGGVVLGYGLPGLEHLGDGVDAQMLPESDVARPKDEVGTSAPPARMPHAPATSSKSLQPTAYYPQAAYPTYPYGQAVPYGYGYGYGYGAPRYNVPYYGYGYGYAPGAYGLPMVYPAQNASAYWGMNR